MTVADARRHVEQHLAGRNGLFLAQRCARESERREEEQRSGKESQEEAGVCERHVRRRLTTHSLTSLSHPLPLVSPVPRARTWRWRRRVVGARWVDGGRITASDLRGIVPAGERVAAQEAHRAQRAPVTSGQGWTGAKERRGRKEEEARKGRGSEVEERK